MYSLSRDEVATILWISTRSVDRYIRRWNLRAQKQWKYIMIDADDVKKLSEKNKNFHQVIVPRNSREHWGSWPVVIDQMYEEMKQDIKKKDERISELSYKLGKAEEVLNNSVSMIEYKKSQYLLEQSKEAIEKEISKVRDENENLEENIRREKQINIILFTIWILLFVTAILVWIVKI